MAAVTSSPTRRDITQPIVDLAPDETPRAEIMERPGGIVVELRLPCSVRPDEVEVELADSILTVVCHADDGFERSFALSALIDPQTPTASVEDGVLRVRLRRAPWHPRSIPIRWGLLHPEVAGD